jgi:hypothetical protein
MVFFALALCGRVAIAHFLENDDDQDGDRYAQIASDVLEHASSGAARNAR